MKKLKGTQGNFCPHIVHGLKFEVHSLMISHNHTHHIDDFMIS